MIMKVELNFLTSTSPNMFQYLDSNENEMMDGYFIKYITLSSEGRIN